LIKLRQSGSLINQKTLKNIFIFL